MKNLLLYMLIFVVLLLAGCTEETLVKEAEPNKVEAEAASESDKEKAEADKTAKEKEAKEKEAKAKADAEAKAVKEKEAAAEAAKAEAEAAKKAKEEEVAAAKKAEEEANAAQVAQVELLISYSSAMAGHLDALSDVLSELSMLTTNAGSNPMLMRDEDWMTEMAITLLLLDETIKSVRNESPPEMMQESHRITLLAMDEYQFVVDTFPTALDNMDANLMDQCIIALQNGAAYTSEATAELDKSMGF